MEEQVQNTASGVEDLSVNTDQAEEVIGGAQVDYFLKLRGVDGEATDSRAPSAPAVSEIVVTKVTDVS